MANAYLDGTEEPTDGSVRSPLAGTASPRTAPSDALGSTRVSTRAVDKWKLRSLVGWQANPDALETWQHADLILADEEFGDGWWVLPRSDADDARFTAVTKRLQESLDLNRIEISSDDWYTVTYTDLESGVSFDVNFELDTDAGMAVQFDEAMVELKAEMEAEEASIRFGESTDRFHETLDREETDWYYGYSHTAPRGDMYSVTYIDFESDVEVDVRYNPTTAEGMSAQFHKAMADLRVAALKWSDS